MSANGPWEASPYRVVLGTAAFLLSYGLFTALAPNSVAAVGTVIPDGELWGGNPAKPIRRDAPE